MGSPLPLAALLALAAPLHAQERPMADTMHVTRSATIHLHGTVAQVFPMFEPVGEARWAAGWSPRFLWPADGAAGVGTTFTTDEHGRESYWTIAEYEPSRRIVYSHLVPGSRSGRSIATTGWRQGGRGAEEERRREGQWCAAAGWPTRAPLIAVSHSPIQRAKSSSLMRRRRSCSGGPSAVRS